MGYYIGLQLQNKWMNEMRKMLRCDLCGMMIVGKNVMWCVWNAWKKYVQKERDEKQVGGTMNHR